jgi:hypothetical protein
MLVESFLRFLEASLHSNGIVGMASIRGAFAVGCLELKRFLEFHHRSIIGVFICGPAIMQPFLSARLRGLVM